MDRELNYRAGEDDAGRAMLRWLRIGGTLTVIAGIGMLAVVWLTRAPQWLFIVALGVVGCGYVCRVAGILATSWTRMRGARSWRNKRH